MPWLAAIGMLIVWELVCRIFNIREFILPDLSVIA
jgi:ABC-type nitrate/sulfonate/bicarbonate transport system permease component